MSLRIVIADDQSELRSAYRMVIDAQPDMTVVGEAADGAAAVHLARRLRPDVVVADVRMPKLDGLEVTRQLAGPGADPAIRVLVVTTFDVDEDVHAALRNGACGFLLKRSGPTLLVEAIRAAAAGDVLISPQLTARLLRHVSRAPVPIPEPALSPRELLVAELVARGLTNAQVAAELHLAVGTVKNLVATVSSKLDVRNRVGIAMWVWNRRGQS
ncbi:response regulator [Pseudactinotalea terrae]|uniref:response regulator n=1 Tax=Pseudactinotalea terrae TaxID=1743262 RepID=UPI0012E0F16D|nr:response regulator transcription factor [Pseudactinotalea terrae]